MNYGSFVESLVVKEEQKERGRGGGSEWNTNREVTRLVLVNNKDADRRMFLHFQPYTPLTQHFLR